MQRFIFVILILLGLLSETVLMNKWFLIPEYSPKILYGLAIFYLIVTVFIRIETTLWRNCRYPKFKGKD